MMNKAEYLEMFRADRAAWETLAGQVTEAQAQLPGVMGDWSFKDLVAHLTGWRKRTLLRVQAGCGVEASHPPSWPEGLDSDSDAGVDQINNIIYAENRDLSFADVLGESHQVLNQLDQALEALPEEAMLDPNCFAWTEGKPLVKVDMFGHWHDEHEQRAREWLARKTRAAGG